MPLNLKEINWLASFPKSGNTWVKLLYQAYTLGTADINANTRVISYDSLTAPYQSVSAFELSQLTEDAIVLLRGAMLIHLIAWRPSPPLIVKTHNANARVNSMSLIPRELTKSAVYLVRDPRDVAASFARHMDKPIDRAIDLMGKYANDVGSVNGIRQFCASWSQNVESWLELDPLIVKYEDLKADTAKHFTRILEHWGINPSEKRVEAAVEATAIEKLRHQERMEGFIEAVNGEFFGAGKGWQNELTPEQAQRIETEHRSMMQQFGYLEFNHG